MTATRADRPGTHRANRGRSAGSEGAVHSHARRALSEGIAPQAVRHTALLAITTLGFPQAMRAATWIEDVLPETGD